MTHDEHASFVGKIVGNSQVLELLLRLFIAESRSEKIELPKPGTTQMPETHVTNYDSLSRLIEKFNANLSKEELKYRISAAAVEVRDTIAHGRIIASSPNFPVTLYRFSEPDESKHVSVIAAEEMTGTWFEEKIEMLRSQIRKVIDCAKMRNYKTLRPD